MQQVALENTKAKVIQNVCCDTMEQLTNLQHIISTSLLESNLIPDFQTYPWNPVTLSHGYPGIICCLSEMNHFFPDQKWDLLTHQCVEKLIEEIKIKELTNISLFSGYAGICFALDLVSQKNRGYSPLCKKLHAHLLEMIPDYYLKPLQHYMDTSQPVLPYLYDHISGVIGVLSYLLNHVNEKETLPCILNILRVLIKLTESIEVNKTVVPGWFISSKDISPSRGDMSHILGACDTGLSHGISGCLAVLAKASIAGISLPGQVEAMQRIMLWLQTHRTDIGSLKDVWSTYIHYQNQKEIIPPTAYRDGWCYGAPGIAFSIFLAACALKDTNAYDYAVDIMEGVCKRFDTQNTLTCSSICHGLSGLLVIVHQMYLATKGDIFLDTSTRIYEHILNQYNSEFPFRYKTDLTVNKKSQLIDNPGLLDGSAGIVLSLLFYLSDKPRPWLPIFLIG